MSYNRATLIGRLTETPELKRTKSDIPVSTFSIAVDRPTAKGEEKVTDFINIVCWRKAAELVCRWFAKGDMVGIEGKINTRKYEDKNGNKRTAFEVVADSVFFVGGNKKAGKEVDDEPPFDYK